MLAAAGAPVLVEDVAPPGETLLSKWTARKIPSPHVTPRRSADLTLSESDHRAASISAELGEHERPRVKRKVDSFGRNLDNLIYTLAPSYAAAQHSDECKRQPSKSPLHEASPLHDDGQARSAKRRRSLDPERHEIAAPVKVAFDLGTLEWRRHQDHEGSSEASPNPKGCSLAAALSILIPQAHNNAVETASKWGTQLLASSGDGTANSIIASTELCDAEATVTTAVQILQGISLMEPDPDWEWAQNLPRGFSWCVGGSVLATYEARDKDGCAQSLVLVACQAPGAASTHTSGRVAAMAKTCERHCVIRLDDVMVDGQWWQTLQLKKCTWACCGRTRPFASPPEIPWGVIDREHDSCCSCAQQKQFLDALKDQTPAALAEGISVTTNSPAQPQTKPEEEEEEDQATTSHVDHVAPAHRDNSPPVRPAMPPRKN